MTSVKLSASQLANESTGMARKSVHIFTDDYDASSIMAFSQGAEVKRGFAPRARLDSAAGPK